MLWAFYVAMSFARCINSGWCNLRQRFVWYNLLVCTRLSLKKAFKQFVIMSDRMFDSQNSVLWTYKYYYMTIYMYVIFVSPLVIFVGSFWRKFMLLLIKICMCLNGTLQNCYCISNFIVMAESKVYKSAIYIGG